MSAQTAPTTGKTTTRSNGKTYPQFTSMGVGYDTMAGIMCRMAELSFQNYETGPSDGRVTELNTLMDDLKLCVQEYGAEDPAAAVARLLGTCRFVYGHMEAPILSVEEEIEIAVANSNLLIENKRRGIK